MADSILCMQPEHLSILGPGQPSSQCSEGTLQSQSLCAEYKPGKKHSPWVACVCRACWSSWIMSRTTRAPTGTTCC